MRLMISRFNWFIVICSIAATTALINPSFYDAIAIFIGFSSIVLSLSNLEKRDSNWRIEGGIKKTVVLISFILMCLIIPQVKTDLAKFSVSAIAQIKS